MKYRTALFISILAMLLAACSGSKDAAATATREAEDTQVAVNVAETKEVSDSLTETAEAIAAQTEAVNLDNTATADARNAALTQQAAEIQAQRTANAATATAEAQPMLELITQLSQDGSISTSDGRLSRLDDFSESWAQINWFQWFQTGKSPANFVVKADVAWESASDKADWYTSGCGFVFRADREGDNFYMIYLALDGRVRLLRNRNGNLGEAGAKYYGNLDVPKGNAVFMLVVEGNKISAYVNGEPAFERTDNTHTEGRLAYTLISGTNKDFGTRCDMTDVWLWEIR